MTDIRTLLRLDALASGALGALLLALAGVLDGPLGLPSPLSVVVGAGLLAWAAFVGWASATGSPTVVLSVIALNLGYVVLSVGFAVAGWVALTTLGVVFVLVQAAAVAGLADLQMLGLRRRRSVAA